MKTIDLSKTQLSVDELLDSARHESVMVQAADGTSFVLSWLMNSRQRWKLLRQNHAFLTLLDSYKQAQKTISLEEVEILAPLEEIADFWDTHSLADYWDQTHEVTFEVRASRRITSRRICSG